MVVLATLTPQVETFSAEKNKSGTGGFMSNVIDIRSRLKHQNSSGLSQVDQSASVVDIGPMREERIKADRREVKRTILSEFVAVHAVIPGQGLLKVHLFDINEKGLAFDIEEQRGKYNLGEAVELRIYLNYQTYFGIHCRVANVRVLSDEGIIRHGCEFVADSANNDALSYFVKFLESVTASLRRDGGDILVSKINS